MQTSVATLPIFRVDPTQGCSSKPTQCCANTAREVVDVVTEYWTKIKPLNSDIGICPECDSGDYLKEWTIKNVPVRGVMVQWKKTLKIG